MIDKRCLEERGFIFIFVTVPTTLACEPQMYFTSLVLSLRKKRAVNMSGKNDFRDVKPFVLIFANQNKGQNATRVTHRDLSRKNLILLQATTKLICF